MERRVMLICAAGPNNYYYPAPMPRPLKRKLAIAMALVVVLAIAVVRGYFAIIPRGASFYPWTMARVDGPTLNSPDGRRTVRVYFNDAGAMHSGNHWTWIVEDSWLWGRRVVAEGYVGPDVAVSGKPVPLEWGPRNEVRVRFLPGRYKGAG
jgi:hypothetical protein